MQPPRVFLTPQKAFLTFLTLLTLSAWIAFISLFFIPSDAKGAWFLGFSQARWGMIGLAFLLAAVISYHFFQTINHESLLERQLIHIKHLIDSKIKMSCYFFAVFIIFILLSGFLANWHFYQHDEYLYAFFLRAAPFALILASAAIGSVFLIPFFQPSLFIDYGIFIFFILLIALIDSFTNNLEVNYMPWDIKYYYLLAERGLSGERIAPYIYRYATPFLARQIADFVHLSTYQAYTVVAYLGAISQLFFLYLFLKDFGSTAKSSFLACVMIALCQYNVKYLLFDVSRPDHLAYFWVTITSWASLRSQWVWCGIFALLGLQFREHVAIPPFIMIIEQIKMWWNARQKYISLISIGFLLICLVAGIAAPRLLLKATDSTQFIDPQHPATLYNLFYLPLDFKRDLNFFYVITAFLLPTLLLSTRQRIKTVWAQLKPLHTFLIVYSLITLLLTLYGGHDLMRYITFLFLPQAILLSRLFEQPISKAEIITAIFAVLIFNRIFWNIPIESFDQNVDFYGGYDNRINFASLIRWLEIFLSLGLVIGIRSFQHQRRSGS